MTTQTQPGGSPDPFDEFPKIFTPDEAQDIVDAYYSMLQYWKSPRGFGELKIKFEPGRTIVAANAERLNKR